MDGRIERVRKLLRETDHYCGGCKRLVIMLGHADDCPYHKIDPGRLACIMAEEEADLGKDINRRRIFPTDSRPAYKRKPKKRKRFYRGPGREVTWCPRCRSATLKIQGRCQRCR